MQGRWNSYGAVLLPFVYADKLAISKLAERMIIMYEFNTNAVPLNEKFLLTIKEASSYFNIGENKMHRIANEYKNSDCNFVLYNGSRMMIKRKKFEEFLCETTTI